jgi:hypothetical protein
MLSYTNISTTEDKSFKGIIQDALFIFAFFPAMKCLVTIMEITHIGGLKLGRTSMLDYAIQFIGLAYLLYYMSSNKFKK